MKKYFPIILALIIILAGCGAKDPQLPEEDSRREELVNDLLEEHESQEDEEDTKADQEKKEEVGEDVTEGDVEAVVQPDEPKSPLTGLPYDGEYKPVAIMIENSAAARPQSGLIDADLVYEAHAEGGITRFLAFFLSKLPEVAGPVRSVRHYYMHMAREWDALLVHYGQSFIAEEQFDKIKVNRLNGYYTDKPFWRDKSRKAPHNVYIDVNKCRERIDFEQEAKGFKFSKEPLEGGREYTSVTFPYSKSVSMVEYRYDKEKGVNLRYMNGKPHTDKETGEQLYNTNIIVQYAKHGILEPGAGYREVEVIGSGKAMYFIGGKYYSGTWERKGPDSQTVYYNEDKEPVCLLPGKTWIQVVPDNMEISIK